MRSSEPSEEAEEEDPDAVAGLMVTFGEAQLAASLSQLGADKPAASVEDEEEEEVLGFDDEFETIDEDEDGLPVTAPKEDKEVKRPMHIDPIDVAAYKKLPMRMADKSSMPPGACINALCPVVSSPICLLCFMARLC